MIILRQINFSNVMLDRVTSKLDKSGLRDYEISNSIPQDSISLSTDLNNFNIYIPRSFEYSQYSISEFLRDMNIRTRTNLDRNIYVMRLSNKLTEAQYFNLAKFIIEEDEYCVFLEQ